MRKLVSISMTLIIITFLLVGITEMPEFGSASNPAHNEVMERYVVEGVHETGAMNIVTGMILDYRAFDTFIEATVLFTACISILMFLKTADSTDGNNWFSDNIIIINVAKILVPAVQIFGLYVIVNGHLSPGGGFAGGTLLGVSMILYRYIFGVREVNKIYSFDKLMKLMSFSLLTYGTIKGYSFITGGGHYKGFTPPLGTPGNIFSAGYILPLNVLVGLIVGITFYFIVSVFEKGEI